MGHVHGGHVESGVGLSQGNGAGDDDDEEKEEDEGEQESKGLTGHVIPESRAMGKAIPHVGKDGGGLGMRLTIAKASSAEPHISRDSGRCRLSPDSSDDVVRQEQQHQ